MPHKPARRHNVILNHCPPIFARTANPAARPCLPRKTGSFANCRLTLYTYGQLLKSDYNLCIRHNTEI